MVPCTITIQDVGSWLIAILGVAAHIVWVWPQAKVGKCMACNQPVWVKNCEVVEVCTALLQVSTLGVEGI